MKDKFKLFCFGFGQVAKYFVKNLIKKNFDVELITTNTTKTQMQKLDNLERADRDAGVGCPRKNLLGAN